jgi:hypothetical protein
MHIQELPPAVVSRLERKGKFLQLILFSLTLDNEVCASDSRLCMCVCVCMYPCIYIYVCVCVYIYIYAYVLIFFLTPDVEVV